MRSKCTNSHNVASSQSNVFVLFSFPHSQNRMRPYSMIASSQLGRHTYKEQFVCFYRYESLSSHPSSQVKGVAKSKV